MHRSTISSSSSSSWRLYRHGVIACLALIVVIALGRTISFNLSHQELLLLQQEQQQEHEQKQQGSSIQRNKLPSAALSTKVFEKWVNLVKGTVSRRSGGGSRRGKQQQRRKNNKKDNADEILVECFTLGVKKSTHDYDDDADNNNENENELILQFEFDSSCTSHAQFAVQNGFSESSSSSSSTRRKEKGGCGSDINVITPVERPSLSSQGAGLLEIETDRIALALLKRRAFLTSVSSSSSSASSPFLFSSSSSSSSSSSKKKLLKDVSLKRQAHSMQVLARTTGAIFRERGGGATGDKKEYQYELNNVLLNKVDGGLFSRSAEDAASGLAVNFLEASSPSSSSSLFVRNVILRLDLVSLLLSFFSDDRKNREGEKSFDASFSKIARRVAKFLVLKTRNYLRSLFVSPSSSSSSSATTVMVALLLSGTTNETQQQIIFDALGKVFNPIVSNNFLKSDKSNVKQENQKQNQHCNIAAFDLPTFSSPPANVKKIFAKIGHDDENKNSLKKLQSDSLAIFSCDFHENQNEVVIENDSNNNHHHHRQVNFYSENTQWCEDISPQLHFGKYLKFGTKTGVYTDHEQRNLIKHFNALQYINGFRGLHFFLQSPLYLHPVIHAPQRACIVAGNDGGGEKLSENQNQNQNQNDDYSAENEAHYSDSVFQFQPLVQNQKSLSAFMKNIKYFHHGKEDAIFSWRDRIDLAAEVLCAFEFLHSHPRGPFSFDDNHPDQYLVVNKKLKNENQEKEEGGRYALKMVDIDTLQRATPITSSSSSDSNSLLKQNSPIIRPKGAAPHKDTKIQFHRHRQNTNKDFDDIFHLDEFRVRCRCFYCRGCSNCAFANTYEGYRACGQQQRAAAGTDDGNHAKPAADPAAFAKGQCTLLTDSWFLGQLLFFMLDGDLLFPASMPMSSIIATIDKAVEKNENYFQQDKNKNNNQDDNHHNEDNEAIKKWKNRSKRNSAPATSSLLSLFPHIELGFDHKRTQKLLEQEPVYADVIKQLLIDRVSPLYALKMLSPLWGKFDTAAAGGGGGASGGETKSCDFDKFFSTSTEFTGLRVIP